MGSRDQSRTENGERLPAATDSSEGASLLQNEFEQLADSSSDLFATLDTEGCFTYVNEAVERVCGRPPDEIQGGCLDDLDLPERLCSSWQALLDDACETREVRKATVTIEDESEPTDYLLKVVPSMKDGDVEALFCVVRQVGEPYTSEKAIVGNGASMGQILDSVGEGAYITNQDYEIVYANPALLEDFGPIHGRKCYEYMHERQTKCPWCRFDEVLQGETVVEEYRYSRVGKTYEMVSFPVKDADGKIAKMKFFRDVSKPRSTEPTHPQQSGLLEEVLTRIPAGVCIIDASTGELQLWNQRADEIWRGDLNHSEPPRRSILGRLYTPEGDPIPDGQGPLWRAINEGRVVEKEECLFKRGDGSMATLLVSATPIRNEEGKITAGVAVITDITDRKRVEEALRRTSEELDDRVRKRTAELAKTNEALRDEVTQRERAQRRIRATSSILELFIHASERGAYLQDVAELLQGITDCQCVGIRMKNENGDVPYEASLGFSEEFLESECWLQLGRDQCVCTRVIAQESLPQEAHSLTPAGSFYCNTTAEFLAALSEEQQQSYRGRCVQEGYSSLAVVPIWYQGRTIGAVHLADTESGLVSAETVEFIESITPVLGEAVHRFEIEKDLRDTNSLLERIFDTTHVLVAYLDPEFNFIRVNRAYAEIDGRPRDFFPGKNHFDLYPHEENEKIFRRVARTGEPYFVYAKAFEHPRQPDRGTTYWDWSLLPVKDENGDVEGLLLTLLDVTERVQAHQQLGQYQKELRSLASELSMAEQRERRRIARNLHDDVSQTLALAQMRLGAIENSIDTKNLEDEVRQVRDYIGKSLHSTRSLTFDLSPPMLYEMGLEAALERLVDRMNSEHSVDMCFQDDGCDKTLPTEVRVSLFRAVRELIINAVKYSQADRIEVGTTRQGDCFRITVEDNGMGFDPEEIGFHRHKEGGFGLFNIQERTRHLGGEFELQSAPGEGTRATLSIPLDKDKNEE